MIRILNEVTKQWQEFNILIPFTVNKKLDESLDTATVERLVTSFQTLPPLTKIQLVDGANVTDWLVQNCTCKDFANVYLQTIELIEPTEILKGYPIENITFTQPIDPTKPRYNLRNVVNRAIRRRINKTGILQPIFLETSMSDYLTTIDSPEFFFTELNLFDAMFEVGKFIDRVPRLYFSASIATSGQYVLTFDELDIKNKTNYTVTGTFIEEIQHPLDNYASHVVSNVKNLNVENTIIYPGNGLGIYVNVDYEGTNASITESNAIITLPTPIREIVKLEIKRYRQVSPDAEYKDFTYAIMEFGKFKLQVPGTLNAKSMYYKYNTNKIENVMEWWSTLPGGVSEPAYNLRRSLFRITYKPYTDNMILINNESTIEYSVIYNQNGNIIEAKLYIEHLKNYIKRMKQPDYVLAKFYKTLADMPQIGHKVNNDFILTNISYTKKRTYYEATMQLSKDYTRRAEFIRAKQEIRNWEIPSDNKVTQRNIVLNETVKFSLGTSITNTNTTKILLPPKFFNILFGESPAIFEGALLPLFFRTSEGNFPILLTPIIASYGEYISVGFKAIDNTIIGYSKALNWSDEVRTQQGVTYTDSLGEVTNMDFALTVNYSHIINSELLARDYPIITQSNYTSLKNLAILRMDNVDLNKDGREVIEYSHTIKVDGVNDTLIHHNLTRASLGQIKNFTIKILCLNKLITQNNEKILQTDIVNEVTPTSINYVNNQFVYTVDKNLISPNYQSIVIAFDYTTFLYVPNQTVDPDDDFVPILNKYNPLVSINNPSTAIRNNLLQNGQVLLYISH